MIAKLAYLVTDCTFGPGGHIKFSSYRMRRDGSSIAPRCHGSHGFHGDVLEQLELNA